MGLRGSGGSVGSIPMHFRHSLQFFAFVALQVGRQMAVDASLIRLAYPRFNQTKGLGQLLSLSIGFTLM